MSGLSLLFMFPALFFAGCWCWRFCAGFFPQKNPEQKITFQIVTYGELQLDCFSPLYWGPLGGHPYVLISSRLKDFHRFLLRFVNWPKLEKAGGSKTASPGTEFLAVSSTASSNEPQGVQGVKKHSVFIGF